MTDPLQYPIGKFEPKDVYSEEETRRNIRTIANLPDELKKILKKMNGQMLGTSYRKGGWTARQVVHHLADSHLNAYIRMKMAVTEIGPTIKPYEEKSWAETEDGRNAPVKFSLKLLSALTKRWTIFLSSLTTDDLEKGYYHPEQQKFVPITQAIALYAWHARHHQAHILLVARGFSNPNPVTNHLPEFPINQTPTEAVPKKRGPKPKTLTTQVTTAEPKKRGPKPKSSTTPITTTEPKKRGPKPKASTTPITTAEPKKRGPKPKIQATPITTTEPKKRGPKPKDSTTPITTAEPKKRGPKPKIQATPITTTEPIKRGPKPKIQATPGTTAEPKKRGPKPKASTTPIATAEPKKRGPKPKIQATPGTTTEPKKRGPKPKASTTPITTAEPKKRGPKPKIA